MSEKKPKVLIVDDRDRYVGLAHELLKDYEYATRCELLGPCWECDSRPGCSLTHAHDWSETASALAKHPDIDAVLLDVSFDLPKERLIMRADGDVKKSGRLQGIEILRKIRETLGSLPVILMTSVEELGFEYAAEQLDVDEFVTMAGSDAFDARALGLLIERVVARSASSVPGSGFVWGRNKAMSRLWRDAESLARTSLPMLILGEPGTGKSALAESVLHKVSGRSGPFVVADLAAIPETLMAAELFGTAKGAFSGAVDRAGCFERAKGGTLFLDEVGNLSEEVQRMLLLTLQSGRFSRLGDGKPRAAEVKLIAATNSDLAGLVRAGAFRPDLYARLNPAAALTIVPLRERREDIEQLACVFAVRRFSGGADKELLSSYMKAAGLKGPARASLTVGAREKAPYGVTFVLSQRTFRELCAHSWPGNVRELELLISSAAVFALSDALNAAEQMRAATSADPGTIPIPAKLVRELLDSFRVEDRPAGVGPDGNLSVEITPKESLRMTVRDVERQLFVRLFRDSGGDFRKMALALLEGDPDANERRVRLRFNQLGLKVRDIKR